MNSLSFVLTAIELDSSESEKYTAGAPRPMESMSRMPMYHHPCLFSADGVPVSWFPAKGKFPSVNK
jgi:hypothetical protein